jgi:ABC-type nitrate/sulfonate/bicarbonate transport system ATPase subunit
MARPAGKEANCEVTGVVQGWGLGTFALAAGEAVDLVGAPSEVVVRAFLEEEPEATIRVRGAHVGSREARSVMAVAFGGFRPLGHLQVLEHLVLAVRIGPPRLGRVPRFREVLEEVGLGALAGARAEVLDADGRWRLGLAMALVRPVPLWVLAVPEGGALPEPVRARVDELRARGGSVLGIAREVPALGHGVQLRRVVAKATTQPSEAG